MTVEIGLSRLAVPLVHLAGLDVNRNAVHKYIQDTFRHNQTIAARFDFVAIDHNYPPASDKKEHIDMYIPHGAMKLNWINKHLSVIPSVICLFVDLEWNEASWTQRLTELVSKLAIIRHLVAGRRVQLCLVLLQSQDSGEKNTSRVEELREQTQLNKNGIFILPVMPDHLSGYIQQLQSRLLERSHAYYDTLVSELKLKMENNASKVYPLLYCRFLFKVAFFSEIRQNFEDAITFFKHCFSRLTQADLVPMTPINYTEIRAFASLVNYKLVKLYLTVSPYFQRDFAVKQFNRHIDYFSRYKGQPELGFEYYAWLAEQYRSYGELLSEHHNGLRVNSQAAFFLLKAANYERKRSEFVRQIRVQVVAQAYPKPDPLAVKPLVYLGERVWRENGLKTELSYSNQQAEMIATFSLQYRECQFDHCLEITRTLHKANTEFTNSGYMRFRPQLLITMAEEYLKTDDPEALTRAGTLLSKCSELLNPTWPLLTTRCYSLLRECSGGETQRLAKSLLYLASKESKCTEDQRVQYSSELAQLASSPGEAFTIDGQSGFVKCFFEFALASYFAAEDIKSIVTVTNDSLVTVTIDQIEAKFSQSPANESVRLATPLVLEPDESRRLTFDFNIPPPLAGKTLIMEEVSLKVGRMIISFDRTRITNYKKLLPFDYDINRDTLCLRVADHAKTSAQSCKIKARNPSAYIIIEDPLFIYSAEMVPVNFEYDISENTKVESIKLTIQCNKEASIETTKGDLIVKDPNQTVVFSSDNIHGEHTVWIMTEERVESSLLVATLTYFVDGYHCSHRAEIRVPPAVPFKLSSKSATAFFRPLLCAPPPGKPFLNIATIELHQRDIRKDIPLTVRRVEYIESDHIRHHGPPLTCENIELSGGDSAQAITYLELKANANLTSVDVGRLKIFWSRTGSEEEFCFMSPIGSLPVEDESAAITLEASIPDEINQWKAFELTLNISNESDEMKTCSIQLEPTADFKVLSEFSSSFHLIPNEQNHLRSLTLYPITSGNIALPQITLRHSHDNKTFDDFSINSELVDNIIIRPTSSIDDFRRNRSYPAISSE